MSPREPDIRSTLRPAGAAAGIEPLERRALLAGSGLAGAYFARTNLTDTKFARKDPVVDFQWPTGTPATNLGNDGFSVRWTGQVEPKFSETHTFIATSTGGVRVWVNSAMIIDAWSNHSSQENQGSLKLTAGKRYSIRIDYWSDGQNTPAMKLEWQSSRTARSVIPANRLYSAILDSTRPSTPGHLRVTSSSNTSAALAWDPSKDSSGVVAYDVYVGSSKVGSTLSSSTVFTRAGLAPQTGYMFSVMAIDPAGNSSAKASTAVTTASGPGQRAPSVPSGVHVVGTTSNSISLAWNASTDDGVVTGYRIYRNGAKIGSSSGTSFTDQNLAAGSSYTYSIRAADNIPLYSAGSKALAAHTGQVGAHNAFSGITGSDYDASSGVIPSGSDITNADDGDWVRYDNVNFGSGAKSVTFSLALDPNNRGGWIELHLDNVSGQQIARYDVQPTGSWSTYYNQRINITQVSGTHNLYLVFKGRFGVGNVRSTTFSDQKLIRIMPMGDSITQQSSASPSYRYYLWNDLVNNGYDVDFVGSQSQPWDGGNPPQLLFDQNHEGHAGWTADDMANNAASWMSQNFADVVLLHAGTNDFEQGQSINSTLDNVSRIISELRSVNPKVIVLLAQLIPENGLISTINDFNSQLPALASSMSTGQSPVIIVDQNTGFSTDDLRDGVHPDATGDQKMADKWFDALKQILQ